jgi:hypothetical protein
MSKGKSEAVNARRTDNTIAKRKGIKGKTIFCKILQRKLKIEQHETTQKTWGKIHLNFTLRYLVDMV